MSSEEAIRSIRTWFLGLSSRERMLVSVAGACAALWLVSLPVVWLFNDYKATKTQTELRKTQYLEIAELLGRYDSLNERLNTVRAAYDESQMSYGDVIAKVEEVIKKATGSTDMSTPKRSGEPEAIGLDYRKERFTTQINSITLEQLVDVLYELEYGDSPLFIESLEVGASQKPGVFRVKLLFSSIQKQQAA